MKTRVIFWIGVILFGVALLALSPLSLLAADPAPVQLRVTGDALHNLVPPATGLPTGFGIPSAGVVSVRSGGKIEFLSGSTLDIQSGSTVNFPTGVISWASVNKTGSSLADLATRSAADLSSGTLLAARMPAMTGDATSTAGTVGLTLATVNSNVGTFAGITLNAKGLVTGASALTIATTAPLAGGGTLGNLTISIPASTNSVDGYLTAADHTTFAAKQPAGNYIMALTGDVSAAGPGSVAATLATVATGATTGSSTAIPVITFNNKGLVTGVTTAAVIAPAGTLTGTTLAANVVTSSLTTVGTIGSGTWQGTVVAGQYGGTGVANTGKTITLGGNLTTSGAFATTLTATATTALTLPTTGTLATLAGVEVFTNKDLTATSNTYRAATTSVAGAVTLSGSTNAVTGTSATLVPAVSDAAWMTAVVSSYTLYQRAILQPNPVVAPTPLSFYEARYTQGTSSGVNVASTLQVGAQFNVWRYTEDSSYAGYSLGGSTTRNGTVQTTLSGIVLTNFTGTNFYSSIHSNIGGLGLTPFTTGKRYMVSCFVQNQCDRDQWIWMRALATSGSAGQGPKLIPAGGFRRIWIIGQATSTTAIDFGDVPAVALGSGTGAQPYWYFNATPDGTGGGYTGNGDDHVNMFTGGFQIEQISDTAKDGIAGIGDSTMQGASGTNDLCTAREWLGWTASMLNVPTMNRGVSGNKTSDMIARWSTDMTPLAATAKYAIIQGGVNDIPNGVSAATLEANLTTLAGLATTDGFIPVMCTVTPSTSIAAFSGGETIRTTVNTWIKQNFPLVIDLSAIVADPYDASQLRRQANWVGDGIHYGSEAKRAIGAYVAAQTFWSLPRPSPYQAIATTTYSAPTTTTAVNMNITNGAVIDALAGGSAFVAFTGPTTSVKTFTLPNASATILTSNAAVTAIQGGTGASTYALGDTLYSSATNTLAKLAGNITAAKQYLSQTGTGSVSAAPAWAAIAQADVTGLTTGASPTFAGLTLSGQTSGRVAYYTASGQLTGAANLTFDGTTLTPNTMGSFIESGTVTFGSSGGTLAGASGAITATSAGTNQPINLFLVGTAPVKIGASGDTFASVGSLAMGSGTTSAKGIYFGTETYLYRSAAGTLTLNTSNTAPTLSITGDGGSNQEASLLLTPQGSGAGSGTLKIIGSGVSGPTGLGSGVHFLIGGTEYLTFTTGGLLALQATDATSSITGGLRTVGGLGVTKAAWIGGLANVAGVLTAANATASTTTANGGFIALGGFGLAGDMHGGGSISLDTLGKTLSIKSGANGLSGTVTLVAGIGTITSTAIDANTVITFSEKTAGGTPGLYQPLAAVTAGSASVTSAVTDTSTYNWIAFKIN